MRHILLKLTGYDSNPNFFTIGETLKEANRKFANTYLQINNKLRYVLSFGESRLVILNENGLESTEKYENIDSLEPWMPEPGIYKTEDYGFIYLHRTPKRQWLKSFSLDNNYTYISITEGKALEQQHIQSIYNDWKTHGTRDWIQYQHYIIYKFHIIGYLKNEELCVTDPSFYEETVQTWSKIYHITLLKNPPNHVQGGNSNTQS